MRSSAEFAEEHRRSLEQNQPTMLAELQKSGEITSYLQEIGREAKAMYDRLYESRATTPGWTPDQAERMAMEVVMHDLILVPDPETAAAIQQDGYLD